MMRICHVTSLHPVNDGRIFDKECKSLSKKYEVYLVAPNTETRIDNGIHIIGVSLPAVNQRIQRWIKLKRILKPLYDIDADVYHFHDPELIRIGLRLKKRGKKIIFDSHEDVPMLILSKQYIPCRRFVSKIYALYEKHILKQYTALVSVTVHIVDRLKKVNPNTYQITNYPKYEERTSAPWDRGRNICFAGLLVKNWMLENIIEVLPQVNANMYLAGRYATEDYLNEMKALPGWKNVSFMGTLPHSKVIDLYNKSTLGLAIESYDNPNAGYKTGSLGCTKIPDYMASGIPVIVSDSLVWGGIVRKYDCGVVVEDPNNKEEIARAINSILDDTNRAKEMGENALKAAKEEFNWDSQEKVLLEMYHNILGE